MKKASNLSSVMETETIPKNEAGSKSLMSRVNHINSMYGKWILALFVVGITMMGCEKKGGEDIISKILKSGLTQEIHDIIADDILEELKDLGIEINGGDNPPNVEGTYMLSPLILVKSNFDDDRSPGYKVADLELTFSKQNNSKLTIVTDYVQRQPNGQIVEDGIGLGSFITGDGNKFSVFIEMRGTYNGEAWKSVQIYSGEITSSGIKNCHWAVMATVANPYTMNRGEGRLYEDSDGLAERIR